VSETRKASLATLGTVCARCGVKQTTNGGHLVHLCREFRTPSEFDTIIECLTCHDSRMIRSITRSFQEAAHLEAVPDDSSSG